MAADTTSSSVDKADDTQKQTASVTPKAATPIPDPPPPKTTVSPSTSTASSSSADAPDAGVNDTQASGIQPGYKIITNLQPCQQHIPLSNGTGIDLGPYLSPTRSSAPVLGKLLNKDFMKRMVHLKRLRVDG